MTRWIWIAVIAAACGGKKDDKANTRAFAEIKLKYEAYETCLVGNQKDDFTTAVALSLYDSTGSACATTDRADLAAAIEKLAHLLGGKSPPPAPFKNATLLVIDKVCSDLAALVASANALAVQVNEPAIVAKSCHPTMAETIEPPSTMKPVATRMWRDGDALIAHDETPSGSIARYSDGKWDQREPPEHMHEFSWHASGPVAVTWRDQDKPGPRSIVVANGTSEWTVKSKIAIDGVSWIDATSGGRVTIDGFPASTATTIWRSTTSGATFLPPVTLFAPTMTSKEDVLDDGTVIAIATEDKGKTTRFEARRLETNSSKPTVTASLSWPEAAKPGNFPKMCAGKTTYWALVGKHVLVSNDIGATWHDLAAIAAPLDFGRLACDDNSVVLWDRPEKTRRTLQLCTAKGCAPAVQLAATDVSMIGFKLGDKPELWIGEHSMTTEPYIVIARPIEAAGLGKGRVMIVHPVEWGPSAIRDGSSYVMMQPTLTTLY